MMDKEEYDLNCNKESCGDCMAYDNCLGPLKNEQDTSSQVKEKANDIVCINCGNKIYIDVDGIGCEKCELRWALPRQEYIDSFDEEYCLMEEIEKNCPRNPAGEPPVFHRGDIVNFARGDNEQGPYKIVGYTPYRGSGEYLGYHIDRQISCCHLGDGKHLKHVDKPPEPPLDELIDEHIEVMKEGD